MVHFYHLCSHYTGPAEDEERKKSAKGALQASLFICTKWIAHF
jgi:hypothetical protein